MVFKPRRTQSDQKMPSSYFAVTESHTSTDFKHFKLIFNSC